MWKWEDSIKVWRDADRPVTGWDDGFAVGVLKGNKMTHTCKHKFIDGKMVIPTSPLVKNLEAAYQYLTEKARKNNFDIYETIEEEE